LEGLEIGGFANMIRVKLYVDVPVCSLSLAEALVDQVMKASIGDPRIDDAEYEVVSAELVFPTQEGGYGE
jgi:hypothetical protein